MACPINCPGPKVPHHCFKSRELRDELIAVMKGKRATGPARAPPAGRSSDSNAAHRKQRPNAWCKLESSEEAQSQSTTKAASIIARSGDAQVLGATSKHKGQVWKPTLRPTPKRTSEPAEQHAAPILLDHTVATAPLRTDTSPTRLGRPVSVIEDGDSCGLLDETVDTKKSPRGITETDLAKDSRKQEHIDVLQADASFYIKALLSWLNYDDPQRFENPISQDTRSALLSVVEASVSVIACSENDLPGMRKPWGDDVLRTQAVAAWTMEESTTSWKSDDWRLDLRALDAPAVEYLMFFSIEFHRKEEFKDVSIGKKFVVACHLSSARQNFKPDPQYFVISCPSNISPLQFATISCVGDQAKWCSDNKLVLPLPE